uniref:Retrovirus-related Pol polyprotein from transposon 297 family n=1 Tax=Cajanus cajan TaxID=3821 RepID=A0A151SBT2_CAJCA|nr:Retrovirus-related Pol polyprotein from transposon 297 family [Cajanus cajan]
MNTLLGLFLRRFVVVFFNDILVYSSSLTQHVSHFEQVFQCLLEGQFYLKLSKYLFAQRQLEYLGHIIPAAGVQLDPSKIQVVLDWHPPANVKALRGFLDLTGFH